VHRHSAGARASSLFRGIVRAYENRTSPAARQRGPCRILYSTIIDYYSTIIESLALFLSGAYYIQLKLTIDRLSMREIP